MISYSTTDTFIIVRAICGVTPVTFSSQLLSLILT